LNKNKRSPSHDYEGQNGDYRAWDSISDGTRSDEVIGSKLVQPASLPRSKGKPETANLDLPLTYTEYDRNFK
jgi:hypothetical protein